MNIIAFIPARGGSKEIPGKNIKLFKGKPLIVWSIESAQRCGLPCIVSTDDDAIAQGAYMCGAEVIMRPPGLAGDTTSMYEVLKSEIPKLNADAVILLQPTSPLRDDINIARAMMELMEVKEHDTIITVERVPEKYNPAQIILKGEKITMASGVPLRDRITRRQEFPAAFIPTGSVYAFESKNLEYGSFYGEHILLLETRPTINLNTLEDWELAEQS